MHGASKVSWISVSVEEGLAEERIGVGVGVIWVRTVSVRWWWDGIMESGKIELGNWKVKSGSSRLRAAGCAGIIYLIF